MSFFQALSPDFSIYFIKDCNLILRYLVLVLANHFLHWYFTHGALYSMSGSFGLDDEIKSEKNLHGVRVSIPRFWFAFS